MSALPTKADISQFTKADIPSRNYFVTNAPRVSGWKSSKNS
jgi:hypothetical protein